MEGGSDEDVYYFNFKTGESKWEHPCDEYYKELFNKEKVWRGLLIFICSKLINGF